MIRLSTSGVYGPERLWQFHPEEFKNLTQQGPGVPDLKYTLSRSLNQTTSRHPFQPSFCCDSLFSYASLCLGWRLPAQEHMCHDETQQDSCSRQPLKKHFQLYTRRRYYEQHGKIFGFLNGFGFL